MDENRAAQMKAMRFEQGKTNVEIGKFFGVSGERVRQIIGNTGLTFRSRWTEKLARASKLPKSTDEFVGVKSVWHRVFNWTKIHHDVRGRAAKYQRWERMASALLNKHGFKNRLMAYGHPFDIELENGIRIDVKSTRLWKPPSHKGPHSYLAGHAKGGRDCDFFFIFIDEETYFIVPSVGAPKHAIVIPWPPSRKPSKYQQYYKRFDLLKAAK